MLFWSNSLTFGAIALVWRFSSTFAEPTPRRSTLDDAIDLVTGSAPFRHPTGSMHLSFLINEQPSSSNDLPLCPCPVKLIKSFNTFNFSVKDDRFEFVSNRAVWFVLFEHLVFPTDAAPQPLTVRFSRSVFGNIRYFIHMRPEMKAEINSKLISPAQRCCSDFISKAKLTKDATVSFKSCFLEVSGLGKSTKDEPPCKKRKQDDSSCKKSDRNVDKKNLKKHDKESDNSVIVESQEKSIEPVKECYFSRPRKNIELEKKERPKESQVTTECDSTLTAYVSFCFYVFYV